MSERFFFLFQRSILSHSIGNIILNPHHADIRLAQRKSPHRQIVDIQGHIWQEGKNQARFFISFIVEYDTIFTCIPNPIQENTVFFIIFVYSVNNFWERNIFLTNPNDTTKLSLIGILFHNTGREFFNFFIAIAF